VEGGYKAIQSTKPQTLGYGLNDSPAGLAGWILEKWRSWADSRGNLDERFSRDFLLTTVTLYWVTQTITSSMRDYFDNDNQRFRVTVGPDEFVNVPTGIAVFANNFVDEGRPPREWAERLYNVRRWTPMPRGGTSLPQRSPSCSPAISARSSGVYKPVRSRPSVEDAKLADNAQPSLIDEVNGHIPVQLQSVCHDTLSWLISFSLASSR
jgi:hypothetical protein